MGALFGFTGAQSTDTLESMNEALYHRGSEDYLTDVDHFATLGYRARFKPQLRERLGAGLHREGDLTIILAGYLTVSDHSPYSLVDLLKKYRDQGIDFVKELRGAFVLVIKDNSTIHLVRDGAGARTLYYGMINDRLYFAEEPKGLLAVSGYPRRIRSGAVAQYLAFSFIPGEDTMLENVFEVLPGEIVSYKNGALEKRRYAIFEEEEVASEQSDEFWVDQFKQTFRQAVKERLAFDDSIAVFLSGGIDSSIVAAELAKQSGKPIKTYAMHFGEKYTHELDFARAVADRCKTEHEEVLIQPKDFLSKFRKMVWHLDDPIGDPITMPNFELSSKVSKEARWVFNGEGGDPLFGGPKNIPMLLHHWYGGIHRNKYFREQQYLASYRRAYEELDYLLTPEWRSTYNSEDVLEKMLTPFFDAQYPKHFLNKLTNINIRLKGGHLILPKVDKMTSAWGVTAHSPLFDERLIKLSFQMPTKFKLDKGIEKVILKQSYDGDLPQEVIDRPKSGMRVPVYFWFQKEMKNFARDILSPRNIKKAGIFNPERVKQLLKYDTEEGPGRYGLRLWMLLSFEVWRRIVIEGEAL